MPVPKPTRARILLREISKGTCVTGLRLTPVSTKALGQGEGEDQVEEQLQGADPRRYPGGGLRRGGPGRDASWRAAPWGAAGSGIRGGGTGLAGQGTLGEGQAPPPAPRDAGAGRA